jgi:hypothetical protein
MRHSVGPVLASVALLLAVGCEGAERREPARPSAEIEQPAPLAHSDLDPAIYRNQGCRIAIAPPRFEAVPPGGVVVPVVFFVYLDGETVRGQVIVKIAPARASLEEVRAAALSATEEAGERVIGEDRIAVSARRGVLFHSVAADRESLYLAVQGDRFTYFVGAQASAESFPRMEKMFRACIDSFRIGEPTSTNPSFYRDPLYDFTIEPPTRTGPPGQGGTIVHFEAVPPNGRDAVEFMTVNLLPPSSRKEVRGEMLGRPPTAGQQVNGVDDVEVSGRPALLMDAEDRESHFLNLLVFDSRATFAIRCTCGSKAYASRARDLRAALLSLRFER